MKDAESILYRPILPILYHSARLMTNKSGVHEGLVVCDRTVNIDFLSGIFRLDQIKRVEFSTKVYVPVYVWYLLAIKSDASVEHHLRLVRSIERSTARFSC